MSKTKINKSVTLDENLIKKGTDHAYIIGRSFSWYVNDLLKKDLKDKKMVGADLERF